MTEPTQSPAQAPGQASPPPAPQQQAPQNQPPAAPPAPNTPAATQPAGTPPAATPPPATVQPNAELIALRAERDRLTQSHTEAQRKITQQGQQLAQLVGATPPPQQTDPTKPFVEILTKQGYDERDARAMVGVMWAMNEPTRQATQQQQAMIQGTSMVNQVLQEAWTKQPAVFAQNPQIGQHVEQILRSNALAGQPIDADYALNLAKIEWANAQFAAATGQTPAPQQQTPPSFPSMWSPPTGFQAPAQVQVAAPVLTPQQQQWSEDIRKTFKTDARPATA